MANNIEIKGIPCNQDEECTIIQTVGEKIGCPASSVDLDVVHCIPTKDENNKNIIARFYSREEKAGFASKVRKVRLCLKDNGISRTIEENPLYVNGHLTPHNKALFSKTISLKKAKNWKFLWTDNCQIKARKSISSNVFCTADESDLAVFT